VAKDDFKEEFVAANKALIAEVKEFAEKYADLLVSNKAAIDSLNGYKKSFWIVYKTELRIAGFLFITVLFLAFMQKIGVCGTLNIPGDLGSFSIACE
jgi:hypothetical protein